MSIQDGSAENSCDEMLGRRQRTPRPNPFRGYTVPTLLDQMLAPLTDEECSQPVERPEVDIEYCRQAALTTPLGLIKTVAGVPNIIVYPNGLEEIVEEHTLTLENREVGVDWGRVEEGGCGEC